MPSVHSNGARSREVFFDDPRLRMTLLGRFTVRTVSYVSYPLIVVATLTFLLSDIEWLRAVGALLALFVGDRLLHIRDADREFREMPDIGRVNLAPHLAPAAFAVVERAYERSGFFRRNFYLEACRELIRSREVGEVLRRLDVKREEFRQKVEELLDSETLPRPQDGFGERHAQTETLVARAFDHAFRAHETAIHIPDLFAALPMISDEALLRLFFAFSLEAPDIHEALILYRARRDARRVFARWPEKRRGLRHRIMNRAWTSRPTPVLDQLSTDITDRARAGDIGFMIGHEEEYERLLGVLSRPANPNCILVGGAGIGKETIVGNLALNVIRGRVPAPLVDKRVVALHLGDLVSRSPEAEFQKRLQTIMSEISISGNIILYIPDIHNLVKTSGAAYLSVADSLLPILKDNRFPVIGATYPDESRAFIESRSDFAGMFEAIHVAEVSDAEARTIVACESAGIERETGVMISAGAVKSAVALAKKFFHTKALPASALELVEEAVTRAKRQNERFVSTDAIVRIAEERTRVPLHGVEPGEAAALLKLEETIHKRFINQDEAVKAVSDAVREYRSGLARPGGPIASFLFVGPTGVGKTELSKALAEIQFGSEKAMARFDMTEYQDKQSFWRLIGSPDGRVRGALTDEIREKPYRLVLLDEFEKAFPEIAEIFLQVLDDGRLTDNMGRTVDFTNTIIVATSNAHSDIINEALRKGGSMTDIAEYLKAKLVDVFKPELLDRFSKIIVFKNLGVQEVRKIVALQLAEINRALEAQGITLVFETSCIEEISKQGYEPAFGARPLRRVIDEKIKAPLAGKILEKGIGRGSRVRVAFREGAFEFVPEP